MFVQNFPLSLSDPVLRGNAVPRRQGEKHLEITFLFSWIEMKQIFNGHAQPSLLSSNPSLHLKALKVQSQRN